jgi:putative aminopeptidase FrvX
MDSALSVDPTRLLENLDALLAAHGPPGAESEVDRLLFDRLSGCGHRVSQDAAGSIVVHVPGRAREAAIAAVSHKDEIALIVKRVEEDGRLRVRPLGGLHPWAVGEGPVEILGDGLVPGVLSIGAKHVSSESPAGQLKDGKLLSWDMMWVETKLDRAGLARAGVRVGSKLVIARPRKTGWRMGDYLGAYNLDCRAGLAILIEVAWQLRQEPPPQDVYLVASAEEELGGMGAVYSLGQLPACTAVAVDIAPAAEEYQTCNGPEPVLVCQDSRGVYHAGLIAHLEVLAGRLGFGVQRAVLTSYGSDATMAKSAGVTARAALIGYPGDNTHGFELCSIPGLLNSARLLLALLRDPLP